MNPLAEHFPLSHYDELPIHQSNEPIRLVATTDPRAFDRYWFTAQDEAGEFFLVTGFGTYPNVGTVDAYALIVIDGRQTTVRARRPMGQDRADLTAGPIRYDLVSAFREWHLTLEDNEQDFTFDLRWHDRKRAVFHRLGDVTAHGLIDFRLVHNWCGYETYSRIEGEIRYKGRTIKVDASRTQGVRDHHWGTRDHVAGYALDDRMPFTSHRGDPVGFSHLGQWVEFPDWALFGHRVIYNLGDPVHQRASTAQILESRVKFDPVTKHLIGGVVVNKFATGEIREIHYEALGLNCAYLRTGGYSGCNGLGTPGDNIHHGMAVGERVDGDTYDLRDPGVRQHLEGFENLLVRATCNGETGLGILESRNPGLHAMASRGIGYSLMA